jgi:hypothetical protein
MNTARALKSFKVTGTGTVLTASYDGVYYVPKVMVRKMTKRKSAYLNAVIWNNSILITNKALCRSKPDRVYVDAKGNMRVPESLIAKAKIPMSAYDSYVVAIQDDAGDIILS